MKNNITKLTLVATLGLLMQACAPDQNLAKADESWLRVTPVDIAQMDQQQDSGAAVAQQQQVTMFDVQSVSVLRYANGFTGSRMSTLTAPGAYWIGQGESFKIFKNDNNDRVAIYACVVPSSQDHFTSRDSSCEGHKTIGLLGYLEKASSSNAPQAVYRCAGRHGHFDTTNPSECASLGYNVEGTLGYTR